MFTVFLASAFFVISHPTYVSRNSGPIHTLKGASFVWFTCIFRVWKLEIHFEGVSGPEKLHNFDPLLDIADLQRESSLWE